MDNRPIGVFDSGVGGLTVVREIFNILPNEKIIYFGDTKNLPYGSKSKKDVLKFSIDIINFFKMQNVKSVVIACNTVSSNCYKDLKYIFYGLPLFEIIAPAISATIKATKTNNSLIIATNLTLKSNKYQSCLRLLNNKLNVFSKACPLFVPIVEEGLFDTNIAYETAKFYLSCFNKKNIDTITLGCTHYPLLAECIKNVFDNKITIVNPAIEMAKNLKFFLQNNNMLNSELPISHSFFTSKVDQNTNHIASLILKRNINFVKKNIKNN